MYTFKKSRLISNKCDLSQAIKGLKESQRTRRQKTETEQFKVEINFNTQNKQKGRNRLLRKLRKSSGLPQV